MFYRDPAGDRLDSAWFDGGYALKERAWAKCKDIGFLDRNPLDLIERNLILAPLARFKSRAARRDSGRRTHTSAWKEQVLWWLAMRVQ